METLIATTLDWHIESVPLPSETQTGDRGLVRNSGDRSLVIALDALGHGPEASKIADQAIDFLQQSPPGVRLEDLFLRCHDHLRATRGATLCMADIDLSGNTFTWLSVGNIQAVHIHVDARDMAQFESLIMRGGVVGDRMPELRASHGVLRDGDMLVFATDGVDFGWYREFRTGVSPRELAQALIGRYCQGKDDALAMAVHCNSGGTG